MLDLANLHQIALKGVYEHYALQKVDELTFILSLLEPDDVVVEIGCDAGGTSWAINQVGVERFVGVDLPGEQFSSGLSWMGDNTVEMIWGDSHDPTTKMALNRTLKSQRVTISIIDGDHSYAGVSEDFRLYGRQLSTGLVIFHDVCHHLETPECQVDKYYNEIKDRYPHTEFISPHDNSWGGIGVLDLSQEGRLERALQQIQRASTESMLRHEGMETQGPQAS